MIWQRQDRGLQIRMNEQDISTKEMASLLGVSFQAVWRYINRETFPTVPHLFEIAQILGSSVDELIVKKKRKNNIYKKFNERFNDIGESLHYT